MTSLPGKKPAWLKLISEVNMSITKYQARKLQRLISNFARAKRDLSWADAQDPFVKHTLIKENKQATSKLNSYIDSLTEKE